MSNSLNEESRQEILEARKVMNKIAKKYKISDDDFHTMLGAFLTYHKCISAASIFLDIETREN